MFLVEVKDDEVLWYGWCEGECVCNSETTSGDDGNGVGDNDVISDDILFLEHIYYGSVILVVFGVFVYAREHSRTQPVNIRHMCFFLYLSWL